MNDSAIDQLTDGAFATRYGPWALVAGASEGVGAAFARQVAQRGVNVVLLARRQEALTAVAEEIRAATNVEVRVLVADLSDRDAAADVAAATSDLEVGLVMYCAGANTTHRSFLSSSIDDAVSMVHRNCVVALQICHHFAQPMVSRGSGGLIVLSSGSALVGAPNGVAYGASKAFDMIMAEGLWAELRPAGVDVLGLVLGLTDTPALRRLLVANGELASVDHPAPVPGSTSAEQVAAQAIVDLPNGPTCFAGEDIRVGVEYFKTLSRRGAVELMMAASSSAVGSGPDDRTA